MNRSDQEKLLKEILPSEDMADFQKTSLECGLAGLRRERRRRHIVRASSGVAVLVCLFVGILLKSGHAVRNAQSPVLRAASDAPSELASHHVDFINDDQLLAFFTNQPVALVGKPGDQRLVFLNESESDSTQHPF
jgi:hypothetical protein